MRWVLIKWLNHGNLVETVLRYFMSRTTTKRLIGPVRNVCMMVVFIMYIIKMQGFCLRTCVFIGFRCPHTRMKTIKTFNVIVKRHSAFDCCFFVAYKLTKESVRIAWQSSQTDTAWQVPERGIRRAHDARVERGRGDRKLPFPLRTAPTLQYTS